MTGQGPDDSAESSSSVTPAEHTDSRGTNRQSSRRSRQRAAREGKERLWRWLRTLIGLWLLTWVLAALFVPPDPTVFLVVLVPLWVISVPVAWYLIYRGGDKRLRASELYTPTVSPTQALSAFVVVTLVLKIGGTVALNVGIGPRPYVADAAVSVVSLAVSYTLVYLTPFGRSD